MSKQVELSQNSAPTKRLTVLDIKKLKTQEKPIVALTAYDAHTAKIADKYCDLLLVGDSLGMVVYGFENTLSVTIDMMINHGAAVVRSTKRAMVVVDMPFSSYEISPQQAYENAAKIISKTNCSAIKIEGGAEMADTIEFLTKRGIAVMAHIGLLPQHINSLGGFKAQGKNDIAAQRLQNDALCVEQAGAFSVVVEAVIEPIAAQIAQNCKIPTIGIGASVQCDGQILVTEDMLGCFSYIPKFVKKFAELDQIKDQAIANYAHEVRARSFPGEKQVYSK